MRIRNIFILLITMIAFIGCDFINEHEWSSYQVETASTCMQRGVEVSTCSLCGERKTRYIDKKNHSSSSDTSYYCSDCEMYHVSSKDELTTALGDSSFGNDNHKHIVLSGNTYTIDSSTATTITTALENDGITIEGELDSKGNNTAKFNFSNVTTGGGITLQGANTTLKNIDFTVDSSTTTPLITISGKNSTIEHSSFDLGSTQSIIAIDVYASNATISNSEIKGGCTDNSSAQVQVRSLNAETSASLTITDSKLTGSSGQALNATNGYLTSSLNIENSTITGDSNISADLTIKKSTINNDKDNSSTVNIDSKKLTIEDSKLGGNITIGSSTTGATITNSSIDTSYSNNSLITGSDLTLEKCTITSGSGLFAKTSGSESVIETAINNSKSNNGEKITSDKIRDVLSKEIPDSLTDSVVYPWTSGAKCTVDNTEVPTTYIISFTDNSGTAYKRFGSGEVKLSDLISSKGDGYVGPGFYLDNTTYTDDKKIETINLTGDNKFTVNGDDTEYTTFYVKYEYKVNFNLDGGSGTSTEEETSNNGQITITAPTKEHYTFSGWCDVNDSSKTVLISAPTGEDTTSTGILTKPITLKALWTPVNYTVEFKTDEDTIHNTQSVPYLSKARVPTVPTKTDYTFDTWYSDEKLTSVFNFNTPITEKTTLYAKWKVGLTIDGVTELYDKGTEITKDDLKSKIKEENCHFKAWYTDSTYETQATFSITLDKNTTLYPLYECYVNVKTAESETLSTLPESITKVNKNATITVSDFFTKPTNTYIEKANRKFDGWFTEDGTEVTADTVISKDITLHAKWNVSYLIGDDSSTEVDLPEGSSVSISELTASRKKSMGWIKDCEWANKSGTSYSSNESVVVTTIKQKFYPTDTYYKPTLNQDNQSNKNATDEVQNITSNGEMSVDPENGQLTLPTLTSDNYGFVGWCKKGEDKIISSPYVVSSDDDGIELIPKWAKYTVTLDLADGTYSGTTSYSVKYGGTFDNSILPTTITRTGYNFNGWYNGSTKVTSPITNIQNDITLTANWTIKTFTVTIDKNKGTYSGNTSYTVNYGGTFDYSNLKTITRTGYDFNGWYNDSTPVTSSINNIKSNITITANWTIKTFTVTVNPDDGTTGTTSYTVEYGKPFDCSKLVKPTKSGYSFEGWYNGSAEVTSSSSIVITADTEIKASWGDSVYVCFGREIYKTTSDTDGVIVFDSNSTIPATKYKIKSNGSGYIYMKYNWIRVMLSDGTYAYFFGNKSDSAGFNGWTINNSSGNFVMGENGNSNHFQNGITHSLTPSDDTYTIIMN